MPNADGLRAGDLAPTFTLPDHAGVPRPMGDLAGRLAVLFFYPRADTPGCTTEARDFSARVAAFDVLDAAIIGISADPPHKLRRFRERQELAVTLLSDESHETLRAYSAWDEKSMYGKTFEGILRTTFVIGRDGKIAQVWRGVKVPGHAETVLDFIRSLA